MPIPLNNKKPTRRISARRARSTERAVVRGGLILIGVLWVMVLLDMLVFVIDRTGRLDGRVSLSMEEKLRGKWACRAGLETAIGLLLEDEKDSDSLYDIWALSTPDANNVPLEDCLFTVKVIDEAGKLNINTATKEQLLELPGMTEEIADSILDWKDSDEEIRSYGAESAYYLNLPYPYQARNSQFRTIRELLLVKGVTPQLLYGLGRIAETTSEYNAGWIHYLTCYSYDNNNDAEGNTRININSASAGDMQQQLSITAGQAQWIVQNRSYRSLADLLDKAASNSTTQGSSTPGGTGQRNSSGQNTPGGSSTGGQGTTGQSGSRSGGAPGTGQTGGGRSSLDSFGFIRPFTGMTPFLSLVAAQGGGGGGRGGSSSGSQGGGRGGSQGGGSSGGPGGGRGGFGGGQGGGQGGGRGGFGGGQGGGPGGGQSGGNRPGGGGPGGGQGGGPGGGRGEGRGGQGGGPGGGNRPGGGMPGATGGVAGGVAGGGAQAAQAEPLDLETFYKIADKITTTSRTRIRGRVNINTASLSVLTALLEGRQEVAEDIIAHRESLMDGIVSIADLKDISSIDLDLAKKFIDYVTTRSSVYTIQVKAMATTTGATYETLAVVDRARTPAQVLYYREGAGL